MRILIVEPFYTGSHASWADGYAKFSKHTVDILKLSGHHWKWRMHGGAVTLARRFMESHDTPDLILGTDMLDMTTFLSLSRERTSPVPAAVYFHENQLTYPWSPKDRDRARQRDRHYSFINFVSALAADRVFFNSRFHLESFLSELPSFLGQFPDHQELCQIEVIRDKSEVLPLGFDLSGLSEMSDEERGEVDRDDNTTPLIIWNHRWEYDKNPEEFMEAMEVLAKSGLDFNVAIMGQSFDVVPSSFVQTSTELKKRIIHSGYVDNRSDYLAWLWRADILPVTSIQEFFGASVMEAMYCGCFPVLPKRLAYPELVPAELHSTCFYSTFEELVEKLEHAVTNVKSVRQMSFRGTAAAYDWREMAPRYDDALEGIRSAK